MRRLLAEESPHTLERFLDELRRRPRAGWLMVIKDSYNRGFAMDWMFNTPASVVLSSVEAGNLPEMVTTWALVIQALVKAPTAAWSIMLGNLVDVLRVEAKAWKEGVESLTKEEKQVYYYAPPLQFKVATIMAIVPEYVNMALQFAKSMYPPPYLAELYDLEPPDCFRRIYSRRVYV